MPGERDSGAAGIAGGETDALVHGERPARLLRLRLRPAGVVVRCGAGGASIWARARRPVTLTPSSRG